MSRHRDIAASPIRTAQAAWEVMTELITLTLERSSEIDTDTASRTLDALSPVALALVAPGHLERQPLTLVAQPLRLTICTISGERAFRTFEDENLNPVPGAATATDWTLHVPCPEALASLINSVVGDLENVSTDLPSTENNADSGTSTNLTIDLNRLKLRS